MWSTDLGAFLQPDEYVFLGRVGTLWSWPGQNPYRWRDPSGRFAGVDDATIIVGGAIVLGGAAIYGILASNPQAVNDTINWIKDALTPKPAPKPDCVLARTQCTQGCVAELETERDCGGNNGFQKCVELCLRSLGC